MILAYCLKTDLTCETRQESVAFQMTGQGHKMAIDRDVTINFTFSGSILAYPGGQPGVSGNACTLVGPQCLLDWDADEHDRAAARQA